MRRQEADALRSLPPPPPPPPPPTTPKTEAIETAAFTRRRPLLLKKSRGVRCAEVAGGTAADCAAIFCCCPIGLFNLLVLAMVKLPERLCRRALKKKRCKKRADSFGASDRDLLGSSARVAEEDEKSVVVGMHQAHFGGAVVPWPERSPSEEAAAMEKEMWAKFYGAGFWRSPSQIEFVE